MGGVEGIVSGSSSFSLLSCWRPRDGVREQLDVEGKLCNFTSFGVKWVRLQVSRGTVFVLLCGWRVIV